MPLTCSMTHEVKTGSPSGMTMATSWASWLFSIEALDGFLSGFLLKETNIFCATSTYSDAGKAVSSANMFSASKSSKALTANSIIATRVTVFFMVEPFSPLSAAGLIRGVCLTTTIIHGAILFATRVWPGALDKMPGQKLKKNSKKKFSTQEKSSP